MIVMGLFSVELHDELHGALVGALGWEEVLDRWLGRYPPVARVRSEGGRALVRYEAASGAGFAGWVAAVVARALQEATWERLKACPGCRWVLLWAWAGLAARSIAAMSATSKTPSAGVRSAALLLFAPVLSAGRVRGGFEVEVVRAGRRLDWGGVQADA